MTEEDSGTELNPIDLEAIRWVQLMESGALSPELVRECRRMIGEAAYRIGDFARAGAALSALAAAAESEADRLRALDWVARVEWARERRRGAAGAAP